MATTNVTINGKQARLTENQVHNLRKLAKARRAEGPGGMGSVLLTPAEFKSLYSKGLVFSVRFGTYKGRVPAFITEAGRAVVAGLPQ